MNRDARRRHGLYQVDVDKVDHQLFLATSLVLGLALDQHGGHLPQPTRLHDTVCQKRQAATIATHDLSFVKAPLLYTARPSDSIMITPLFKTKEVSAGKLLTNLQQEADALRREKKRSTVSGIHKYLDLLKDKTDFPCLIDADGQVISFPPITNSDKTKISKDTQSLLVEVTSSVSLDVCKKVMDTLLKETLQMGVGVGSGGGTDIAADSTDDKPEEQEDVVAGGEQTEAAFFLTLKRTCKYLHDGMMRRMKALETEAYTQEEAERAAGMGSYRAPKNLGKVCTQSVKEDMDVISDNGTACSNG
ncbi:hypothetical protein C0Q70_08308 [Pomacea canaliculata]|uniref:B3/B4 tRNA-binding domain-containing protein n=1 Tax=Pomacea canaliculata TaxID=400727 RepID=A0A2T7PHF9_POMCA|nr:hypothetical protein C0Q70_08308 [Pomacea canaliculata]